MPKKYRVDMTITDTEANPEQEVDSSQHEVSYENDAEAKRKFSEKTDAAKKAGKPDKE
jgi:hypothetical protein